MAVTTKKGAFGAFFRTPLGDDHFFNSFEYYQSIRQNNDGTVDWEIYWQNDQVTVNSVPTFVIQGTVGGVPVTYTVPVPPADWNIPNANFIYSGHDATVYPLGTPTIDLNSGNMRVDFQFTNGEQSYWEAFSTVFSMHCQADTPQPLSDWQSTCTNSITGSFPTSLPIDVGTAVCDVQVIDNPTSDVTVELHSENISDCNRNRIWIKQMEGSVGVVTVTPNVGLIDGQPSYVLANGECALFYFDGANWFVLANEN